MKFKKLTTLFMILCLIFLEGCKNVDSDTSNKIVAPKNSEISIKGTWKIEKYKSIGKSSVTTEEINKLLGKTAEFDVNYATFGDEFCGNAEFKMKKMGAKYYFSHVYNLRLKELDLENKDLEVISITSGDKLFYDFIKVSDDEILTYMDNTFFYLTRVSNNIDVAVKKEKIKKAQTSNPSTSIKETKSKNSGILLGLKSSSDEEQGASSYRTLWVSYTNQQIRPILVGPNLFVPRKTGFWVLGLNRISTSGYMEDSIVAYPVDKSRNSIPKIPAVDKPSISTPTSGSLLRNILFVGNDYVSMEYNLVDNNKKIKTSNRLSVLAMDKIYEGKGIKITDIAGENGKEALLTTGKTYLSSRENTEEFEKEPKEDSFALFRKNGHWAVQGRLNSINAAEGEYLDFNVNIMPPSSMLNYDELHVSWKEIKQKVPDALDAYTSPNKDVALVICKNVICVYTIQDKKLSDKPLKRIDIQEGESVVMAEWATGDYVERWEKSFSTRATIKE